MEFFNQIYNKVYFWIFRKQPSVFFGELLKNFLIASGGMALATLLTFGINIFAARSMGPSEFGKWNLIGSWAEFLVIIPLFGMTTAFLRYIGASDEKTKGLFIGSGFRIVVLLSLVCFPIFWIAQRLFHIIPDTGLVGKVFLYGIILTFFYLVQSIFQGLKQFTRLSKLWIVSALVFVGIVLYYLLVLDARSFETLYWGNTARLGLVVVVGLVLFSGELLKFGRFESKQLMQYGSFSVLSVIAGFFSLGSIDIIMVDHYLGSFSVGLLSAYLVAFNIFIGRIITVFSQVFLPMASGQSDPVNLLNNLMAAIKKTAFFVFLFLLGLIWLVFQFYGKEFIFDFRLAALIAFSNMAYGFLVILGNILASTGIRGARIGVVFAITSALINVSLNMLLIPSFKLYGSVFATIAATLTVFVWGRYYIKNRLHAG